MIKHRYNFYLYRCLFISDSVFKSNVPQSKALKQHFLDRSPVLPDQLF